MRECSIEGCGDPHKARGYCNKHYTKFRRGQVLEVPPSRDPMVNAGECVIDGCQRSQHVRNLCSMHYRRRRRGQDMSAPPMYNRLKSQPEYCTICNKPSKAKGYCATHYWRYRLGKDMHTRVVGRTPIRRTTEDARDLREMGLKPWEVADQLGRAMSTVARAARKSGDIELAREFDRVDSRMKRGTALRAEEVPW